VLSNHAVTTTVEAPEEAKARGVMALFGEKYGDRVRVVDVDGWSTELCGGTHVAAAGDIGPFVILSERAIQAGVRRIEAVTHLAALEWMQGQRRLVTQASQALKAPPEELPDRIASLQQQVKQARKQQKESSGADLAGIFGTLKEALVERDGVLCGAFQSADLGLDGLRQLGDRAKSLSPDLALGLFGRDGDRVPFLILCQGSALLKGLEAGALAKTLSVHLGGGGGGRPESAQGQGTNAAGLPAAIEELERELAACLAG
jgi:alanyl-tRNA synthetase